MNIIKQQKGDENMKKQKTVKAKRIQLKLRKFDAKEFEKAEGKVVHLVG